MLTLPNMARADAAHAELRCERLTFSVALAPDEPATETVAGWMCSRGPVEGQTIQVLLHGGTYNHNYWDWPLDPERYSYVQALTAAGYVTLNLDRLGDGESSHPDPTTLTLHVGAYATHQIVQLLRSGTLVVPGLGVVRDNPIELVGHSLGSFISTIEASTYGDVDAVILSGYSHTVGPGIATLVSTIIPAVFDPKFADEGLPFFYLTTAPGTRGLDFYYLPNADPAVIALDEQLKDLATLGEELDIGPSYPESLGVRVPALVAVGDFDLISCLAPSCSASGSLADEASNYPPEACVEVVDIPNSGHDVNLHLNAPDWFAAARAWSDRRVGPSRRTPPTDPCH